METPVKRKIELEKEQQLPVKTNPAFASKKKDKIQAKAEEKFKKISPAKQMIDA